MLMALASANAFLAPLPIIAPISVEPPSPIAYTYAPKVTLSRQFVPAPIPYSLAYDVPYPVSYDASYPVSYDTPLIYTAPYPAPVQVAQKLTPVAPVVAAPAVAPA